ncbi:hypothetical protein [Arthrobacter mobilis]|uniref:Uncharacterized protein n=1 Tax=Arthrobacter mobilis TaxID=2724944 RepID=A0A7X6HFQ5_9MICC|nr:hypothetical protein [Arthrobacter mobilis]NKX56314.1 hypothetical protein [Arthrobacter mobilis]
MAVTNPFGPRSDPRYVRFKEAIDRLVLGKPAVIELRWSPREKGGHWFLYPRARFSHVDFGAPAGPESPLEIQWDWHGNHTWESHLTAYDWPRLYGEVEKRYARFARAHPQAVWNIYDGSWREAILRPAGSGGSAKNEFGRKVAMLKDLQAWDIITDEQLQRWIDELLQEYI